MSITLSLTHDCNLRCSYCYAGRKSHRSMSRETMSRALEWAVGYHKEHRLGRLAAGLVSATTKSATTKRNKP